MVITRRAEGEDSPCAIMSILHTILGLSFAFEERRATTVQRGQQTLQLIQECGQTKNRDHKQQNLAAPPPPHPERP